MPRRQRASNRPWPLRCRPCPTPGSTTSAGRRPTARNPHDFAAEPRRRARCSSAASARSGSRAKSRTSPAPPPATGISRSRTRARRSAAPCSAPAAMLVRFPVRDGAQVLARGRVSLYEARGEFQVVVEHLEEAGEGALRGASRSSSRSCWPKACSRPRRKRKPPTLPRRIGVITSPIGRRAARHPAHPAAPVSRRCRC